jgi:aspartate racemase
MKTIGLIGGLSWVSTQEYCNRLNLQVNSILGGTSSAKIIMESFNFSDILPYQLSEQYDTERRLLIDSAKTLERAGADVIMICSCTTSMLIDSIQRQINVPLMNIVECISSHIKSMGMSRVGLLGTRRVMYKEFFRDHLKRNNIESIIPSRKDGQEIDRIIYKELICNIFKQESSRFLHECIDKFEQQKVDAVILGCTELPLLAGHRRGGLPLIDSIQVHVDDVLRYVLPAKVACNAC